ncbi:universal stress protein [Thermomonospora cellulosilytica]|uniref:Nucleotide-binding universal stress UspA family protein n=1 Tax=Thermomonospora cellulosilytica TaxID=1411118 RepID=A0A7W3R7L2_9ACTN|nr:universal stress protein [Thermomonospora cellulosilytica]MBA9002792.1 nucleotide-binding universal stress UspA family protein [Thermomonospora cellulosilytica]
MTNPFDPVVVGTDGSEVAARAVTWAGDEAAHRNRPLRIVHAVEPWAPASPMLPPAVPPAALCEAGRRILAAAHRAARERHPSLEVTSELLVRSPGAALREQAEGAFEVVVGHRGKGGFASLLLGSTGLHLAGHVPGPVVIVRGEPAWAGGDVIVGVGPATVDEAVLDHAFEAAALRRARLRVVHGWRLPMITDTGYPIDMRDAEDTVRWELHRATAAQRKLHPGVEVVEDVVRGHPVAALAGMSHSGCLVVVGAHSCTGLGALRLGSVGHGIVHHAHCPVAVVRPRS